MTNETPCHEHEIMIQNNTKDIAALETRSDYKEKRIDELYDKIEKMETKLDTINENVNKIVQSSIESDNKLEQRLTKLETTVKVLKWITTLLFGSGLIWIIYSFIH
jgi:uncharacterized coiled-coil protein SlyX